VVLNMAIIGSDPFRIEVLNMSMMVFNPFRKAIVSNLATSTSRQRFFDSFFHSSVKIIPRRLSVVS
jgi:hypothetical protein